MKSCFVVLLVAALAVTARAQIPYFGFCPEYLPMTGFDMERFLGIWYEAERNFQLSEIASRCVMSNYTYGADKKFHVINEVRSRVTGIKRVLEGEIRKAPSKAEEGKLHVKYTSVPVISPETQYNVLETDYDNYAVLWSCSGVGPLNAQNAWIMTRQRLAPGEILQKAYGVLDKYRISKTFFLKTNQEDCAYDNSVEPSKAPEPPKQDAEEEQADDPSAGKSAVPEVAAPVVADVPAPAAVVAEPAISTRNVEAEEKPAVAEVKKIEAEQPAAAIVAEPIKAAEEEAPKTVPEVIMKIADQAKEQVKESINEASVAEPVKEPAKESAPLKEEPAAAAAAVEAAAPVIAEASAPIVPEEKKPEEKKKTDARVGEGVKIQTSNKKKKKKKDATRLLI